MTQITNPVDGQELWTGPVFFNIGGAGAHAHTQLSHL